MANAREINLWTSITSDEQFEKFLMSEALLILDVFQEFFGPCTMSLHWTLERAKLALNDSDQIQLATCDVHKIAKLNRFRRNVRPTILFVCKRKVVDIVYGANIPLINKTINKNLAISEDDDTRKFYNFDEPLDFEQEEIEKKRAEQEESTRILEENQEKALNEKLDQIIELVNKNVKDMGVLLFMPHVKNIAYLRTSQIAKRLGLFNRRNLDITITADHLRVLNYKLENPLEEEVLHYLFGKPILACLWLADPVTVVEESLQQFVTKVSEPTIISDDLEPDIVEDPLLEPLIIDFNAAKSKTSVKSIKPESFFLKTSRQSIALPRSDSISNSKTSQENGSRIPSHLSNNSDDEGSTIVIPPAWTPSNKEGNAMLLYLFFKAECAGFLPVEEEPEPPHVCIVFPTTKRDEVLSTCDKFKDDILAMGFFTNGNLDEPELICKTPEDYQNHTKNASERLILKVAKKTSHCELWLCSLNPLYLSHDVKDGAKDCAKVFNEKYYANPTLTPEVSHDEE